MAVTKALLRVVLTLVMALVLTAVPTWWRPPAAACAARGARGWACVQEPWRVGMSGVVLVAAGSGDGVAELTAAPARRPRGRPRKTLDERDEGNRRQELIRAAARLFRAKGFAATSTRDIAGAVGMHSGSPFYHFESKSALLCEVMEQGMRSAIERQQAMLRSLNGPAAAQHVEPAVALRALIRTHFDILLGPDSDFIPVMLYEWRSLSARQRAGIAQLQRDYEAPWMPLLQALKDAGRLGAEVHLARLLLLGALNWSVQWHDAGQGVSLDTLADAVMDLFIRRGPR